MNKNEARYNNLSEAVAFEIAFEFMLYSYDNVGFYDIYREECTRCRKPVQYNDFLAPKSNCKKEYAILDTYYFGVSEKIKNELVDNFNITEQDFRPVRNKKGEIVFYQITPQHTMLPISDVNRIRQLKPCKKCGSIQHRFKEYKNKKGEEYFYISKEALKDLHDLNVTFEKFDIFIPEFIVSRRVYDFLIERYPRMRFIPLFLKET